MVHSRVEEFDKNVEAINKYIVSASVSYSAEINNKPGYRDLKSISTVFPSILKSVSEISSSFSNIEIGDSYYYDREPATKCLPAKYVMAAKLGLTGITKVVIQHDRGCHDKAAALSINGKYGIFNADCTPMEPVIYNKCPSKNNPLKKLKGDAKVQQGAAIENAKEMSKEADNLINKKIENLRLDFSKVMLNDKGVQALKDDCIDVRGYIKYIAKVPANKSVPSLKEYLDSNQDNVQVCQNKQQEQLEKLCSKLKSYSDVILSFKDDVVTSFGGNDVKIAKINELSAYSLSDCSTEKQAFDDYCKVFSLNQYAKISPLYRELMEGDNTMKDLSGIVHSLAGDDFSCHG